MLLQHIVLIESLAKILRTSIIETEFYQIQSINFFGDALQVAKQKFNTSFVQNYTRYTKTSK